MVSKKNRPLGVIMSMQDVETLLSTLTEAGLALGLADVKAGRFNKLTPEYAEDMTVRFKARLKST